MKSRELMDLAEDIMAGNPPREDRYLALADLPASKVSAMLAGADAIRNRYFGRQVHLCTICNGKSGRCSENCSFCAQSAFWKTRAPEYPLLTAEELGEAAGTALDTPVHRFSVVTSGKGLPEREVETVARALSRFKASSLGTCASLGILSKEALDLLKAAGVTRYHHNLETSASFFSRVCTTHTYQDRLDTIAAAKAAGLSICAGGIFGLGESDRQALEMALTLKKLDVDAVPINFLTPIKGTPLESQNGLSPLRCLKIIALFRYVMPRKEIIICGGREAALKDRHPLIFYSGASGMMTQNYLTTRGRSLMDDLTMIETLGFRIRPRTPENH